ncbi:protein TASOR-like [Cinclus cinclus]|uniref:protein TASOR-like n=1 Tax=Cinclus cinclus TaxID=127875 RepID=UPI002E136312
MAESSSGSSACPFPGHECHPCPRPARDSSQYYVYEVSGGSAAQRLRQVCPYIFLHREHKDTPLLQPLHELVERNYQVPYCPWRGQLSIQGRLLCSIALRSPYSCTVPAQL